MAEIIIPFKDRFKSRILDGTKNLTWRTRRYGEDGDTFWAFGVQFRILKEWEAPMSAVPENYLREGFDSKKDAIQFMRKLRPKRGYAPQLMGWHHWFGRVE